MFTDTSQTSCSQILFVDNSGELKPVCCNSSIFSYVDSLKSAYLKEAISLVRGMKTFEPYVSASSNPLTTYSDSVH